MIIEGEFYKIIPVNEYSCLFDLELLFEIKGKNPRKEFKNAGYGMPFDRAVETIIRYATNKKLPEKVTLKEYLDVFKEETNSIKRQLKSSSL